MADLGSLLGSAGIGGAIGKAIVSLELDTKKYQAEMKAAQAETTAGANKMSSALASFGGIAKAGIAAAGIAVVAFAANAIKAASDLGEAVNKSNVIFGENAAGIRKWSDTGAEAFGLSARAALDAAGGFGAMLQTAGLATGASANMSKALVQLAGDMASFNNIDPTEALEKLRSGLAGEAEPLRRFGVFLSEAAVQQEAYRSGIAQTGAELTEAQKVQARYNIIFEQTTKQQGDFARTADSIPNQLRSMKAEFENISAEVGQKLLPVTVSLLQALKDLLPVLNVLGDALVLVTGYVGDLVAALTLQESGFVEAMDGARRLFQQYKDGKITIIELEEGLQAINRSTGVGIDVTAAYSSMLQQARDGQARAAQAAYEWKAAQDETTEAVETTTVALKDELDAMLALSDPTFALINSVRDLDDAHREYERTTARVNRLEEEGKTGTKAYTEAKREAEDASLALAEAEVDVAASTRALQVAIDQGSTSRRQIMEDLEDIGHAAGLSGTEIRGLKDDVRSGLSVAASLARQLAPEVGAAISHGIALGITTSSELISVSAAAAVHKAMQAAKDAAGAKSPSKVMMQLGVDMMVGLANGISDAEQKAIDAARKAMEKVIDQVSSQLDKIKGKAQSFADAIKGGFSGFLDIGGAFGSAEEGTSLSDIISTQVGGAQVLADVLETLKRQGAGKALLAQVAESGAGFGQALLQGGPEQIKEANAALKTIADLAQETGKGLSEKFFGDKIEGVEKKLDKLHDDLRELNALEREGHSHDIVMDGQKVAEATRSELIKTGKRNPGTGIE